MFIKKRTRKPVFIYLHNDIYLSANDTNIFKKILRNMYVKQKQAELYKEKIYSLVVQKQESRQKHIKNDKEHVMF